MLRFDIEFEEKITDMLILGKLLEKTLKLIVIYEESAIIYLDF